MGVGSIHTMGLLGRLMLFGNLVWKWGGTFGWEDWKQTDTFSFSSGFGMIDRLLCNYYFELRGIEESNNVYAWFGVCVRSG